MFFIKKNLAFSSKRFPEGESVSKHWKVNELSSLIRPPHICGGHRQRTGTLRPVIEKQRKGELLYGICIQKTCTDRVPR